MSKDIQTSPSANGDLQAWMLRYGPGLKRYFQKRVSAAEAEGLVQDVFLAMHRRGADAPVDNVQGYLFTVAANLLARRRTLAASALDDDRPPPSGPFAMLVQ